MSQPINTTVQFIYVKTAFGNQKKTNPNYIPTNGEMPTVQRTIAQVDADRMNQDNFNVQNTTESKGFGVSGYGGYSRKSKKMRSKKRRNNSKKSLRSRRNKRQTKRSRR